jgi:hypothetical protein
MTRTRSLARRTFLRGVGAAIALPMLDAMNPLSSGKGRGFLTGAALAQPLSEGASGSIHPTRMAFVFFPNGAIMPNWRPDGSGGQGDGWQLSKTLQPLAPWKQKINVITGLAHREGTAGKDGAGDHARSSASFLTATRPLKTAGSIRAGISVDQIAAQQLNGQTKLSSIELGLEGSRNAGSCDSGYSCAYSSNISWRSENQPMPKERSPKAAFERLFGDSSGSGRAERDFYRRSILDLVAHDAQQLGEQLGQSDRRKLDEYFASIRDLELRIEAAEKESAAQRPDVAMPDQPPGKFSEHARLMFDLMVLGFQTNTTRIATFMLDNEGSNRTYDEVDVHDGHHQLSHHKNDGPTIEKIKRIDAHLADQFAYFLQRLESVQEGEGTLLDHSMIVYGSGLSDGNGHLHHDLPIVMAGSAGGRWSTDRHLVLPNETPMANLMLTMLDSMGTPIDSIGDSSGRLSL